MIIYDCHFSNSTTLSKSFLSLLSLIMEYYSFFRPILETKSRTNKMHIQMLLYPGQMCTFYYLLFYLSEFVFYLY